MYAPVVGKGLSCLSEVSQVFIFPACCILTNIAAGPGYVTAVSIATTHITGLISLVMA